MIDYMMRNSHLSENHFHLLILVIEAIQFSAVIAFDVLPLTVHLVNPFAGTRICKF
jgi:hypothetical protein